MTLHRAALAALLAVFVVCGFVSLRGDSATFDETAHIGAGVSYLETGDFRLNPEHPPLAKMLAALPLVALGRGGGDYRSSAWTGGSGDEWVFGFELINGPTASPARRDPAARLVPARSVMLLLGALLCLVVYAWGRELWGPSAGLLALALAATCPTVLAHARLVTTDLPGALGMVATAWLLWRWTRVPSWGRALAVGGAFAAALLFKFNTVLLVPAMIALVATAILVKRVTLRQGAAVLVISGVVGLTGIWAGYGFRYAASPDPSYAMPWRALAAEAPLSPVLAFARDHALVPEAYVFGLAYAQSQASGRTAWLDGAESNAGWYRYFPEAFLLKTPLAFVALVVWVIAAGVASSRGRSFDGWAIALVPIIFAAVAIASRFNIGHRHIAPVYPFLCVAAGPAAGWLAGHGVRRQAVRALIFFTAVSFAFATPGYLSYFNGLGGGSRGGWRHLVDSNIDWGQDLSRLKGWMDAHGAGEVDLAYFGTADPLAYGIRSRKVFSFLDFRPDQPPVLPERGRLLAASVSVLQGLFVPTDRAFALDVVRRGWVSRTRAEDYLADREARTRHGEPVRHAAEWMVAQGLITLDQAQTIEDGLAGGWLARARDEWTPIGRAGDSILIYRVP